MQIAACRRRQAHRPRGIKGEVTCFEFARTLQSAVSLDGARDGERVIIVNKNLPRGEYFNFNKKTRENLAVCARVFITSSG